MSPMSDDDRDRDLASPLGGQKHIDYGEIEKAID